ncbi:MAG: DHH family phosphoesterase [Deltaproteobacteria bacterium]|nr:DHH family phosphoesterase [Deltaproteobacteria bacterium]
MDRIIQYLESSKNILLASHVHPDGDAIGSLLALGLSLSKLGKFTTLYNESSVDSYHFLPYIKRIVDHWDESVNYDTAIILDCGNMERTGEAASKIARIPVVINIDHHLTNTGFGDLKIVDSSASSSSEIVYRLIKKMGIPIDKAVATAIYTGIFTDTGSFRFSNTNQAAFGICEELVSIGVVPHQIAYHIYGTHSLGHLKLLNLSLDSLEISQNGLLSMMIVTSDMFDKTGSDSNDSGELINFAKSINGIKVAVLIQELQNTGENSKSSSQFHISLRSNGGVDVADIASSFGGGGHFAAAGFDVESTLTDLKDYFYKLAKSL